MHDQITFTREEIYDLVWKKPMMRLAEEYAISDAGLAKICARHGIPTPPRGYWAKFDAGLAPPRPPLPPTKDASPIVLRVTSPEDRASEPRAELVAAIADEKRPENRIAVTDRLQAPHALVREAKTTLQDAEPDRTGILPSPPHGLDIRVSRAQLPRALRIADTLLKSFEARGWEVVVQDDGTFVHVGEAPIAVRFEEAMETVEVPAKPDLGGGYSFHYNRHETVRKPSGQLSIAIREHHHLWNHAQQRKWRDSDKRVLEDHLNDVVVGMLKLATAIQADLARRAREAQAEELRQRELQAALGEQRRLQAVLAKEKANVRLLLDQAARWRDSQNLRRFIEHAREQGQVAESRLEGQALLDWIQWALHQADRMDPFTPPPPSILDDAERIEHMCDDLRGRR